MPGSRRERLKECRLYLVCDDRPEEFLRAALRGGVDVVQLRMKQAPGDAIVDAGRRFARVCAEHGALLILNDRPDLVERAGADGVHVGQDDVPVADARRMVGPDRLIGLSTHSRQQVLAADEVDVDYIGVGPVHETPTKPGRPAVGLELIEHAARCARMPFFAIGGITPGNIAAVCEAGAARVAVVRALTEAVDPEHVARTLRAALAGVREEARVGSA